MSPTRNDYLAAIMSKHLASVLTTVNAPCSVQLDDAALADCFADLDLAKQHPAHVSAFLGEVPLAQQVEFATAHHIRGRRDEGFCRQVLCLVRRKLSARPVMAGHDSRRPSEWRRLFRIISTLSTSFAGMPGLRL